MTTVIASVRPAGSAPTVTAKEYGVLPPEPAIDAEYAALRKDLATYLTAYVLLSFFVFARVPAHECREWARSTEPGTRIEISGETFSPGQDGTFKRTVVLKEGMNEVKITAVSVGGGKDEAQQKVHVDTKPPRKLEVKPPWGNPEGQTSPAVDTAKLMRC